MEFQAIKEIQKVMDEKGAVYEVEQIGDRAILSAAFSIEHGPLAKVCFVTGKQERDVAVRLFSLAHVKDVTLTIWDALNTCNAEYRFVKFVVDEDGDINMEMDFPEETKMDSVGPMAFEMFVRMMQIADEVYPELMKAIWT